MLFRSAENLKTNYKIKVQKEKNIKEETQKVDPPFSKNENKGKTINGNSKIKLNNDIALLSERYIKPKQYLNIYEGTTMNIHPLVTTLEQINEFSQNKEDDSNSMLLDKIKRNNNNDSIIPLFVKRGYKNEIPTEKLRIIPKRFNNITNKSKSGKNYKITINYIKSDRCEQGRNSIKTNNVIKKFNTDLVHPSQI